MRRILGFEWNPLIVLFVVWLMFVSTIGCGPSAEEKAKAEQLRMEQAQESEGLNPPVENIVSALIKINFTNCGSDTLTVRYKRGLRIMGNDLVDDYGKWQYVIARNVNSYTIIKQYN